jgi:molybdenum cofactor cytidylyltransferase
MIDELAGLPVIIVRNIRWRSGMAGSIRAGLRALLQSQKSIDGTLFTLVDQPMVTTKTLRSLVAAARKKALPVAAAEYDGIAGVPAFFDRAIFPELRRLAGPEGARKVILKSPQRVARVPFPAGAIDLDFPEDYAKIA